MQNNKVISAALIRKQLKTRLQRPRDISVQPCLTFWPTLVEITRMLRKKAEDLDGKLNDQSAAKAAKMTPAMAIALS